MISMIANEVANGQSMRDMLASATAEFLASGGEVNELPIMRRTGAQYDATYNVSTVSRDATQARVATIKRRFEMGGGAASIAFDLGISRKRLLEIGRAHV